MHTVLFTLYSFYKVLESHTGFDASPALPSRLTDSNLAQHETNVMSVTADAVYGAKGKII